VSEEDVLSRAIHSPRKRMQERKLLPSGSYARIVPWNPPMREVQNHLSPSEFLPLEAGVEAVHAVDWPVPLIPHLDILPRPQRALWPELEATPAPFTLYGGMAIALRLGHRAAADFDFFTGSAFEPATLIAQVPYLSGCTVRHSETNALMCSVDCGGPVQLSFIGGLSLGVAAPSERVQGPQFPVASLLDLAGMKVAAITERTELNDYLDIHAMMTVGRIELPVMLAAAAIIHDTAFRPKLALKALASHDRPALAGLSQDMSRDLIAALKRVGLDPAFGSPG